MIKSPNAYGVSINSQDIDSDVNRKCMDLIHSAAVLLDQYQLIKYERLTGQFGCLELGRIASRFSISHSSMIIYDQNLRSAMSTSELLRIFALSSEFKHMPVTLSQIFSNISLMSLTQFRQEVCSLTLSQLDTNLFPGKSRASENIRMYSDSCGRELGGTCRKNQPLTPGLYLKNRVKWYSSFSILLLDLT